MEKQSRRSLFRNAAKAALVVISGGMIREKASALTGTSASKPSGQMEKRLPAGITPPSPPVPISNVVAFGNLLFFSSVGEHAPGTIEEHTRFAIDELEKNLMAAGSSLQKVLKVSVFLKNIDDYDRMNVVYKSRNWGPIPPARTVIAPAGIPYNPLFEIDCIAYI